MELVRNCSGCRLLYFSFFYAKRKKPEQIEEIGCYYPRMWKRKLEAVKFLWKLKHFEEARSRSKLESI